MEFAVTWRSRVDGVLLAVSGEVDIATAPALQATIVAALDACTPVSLDLSRLTFIDAAGLGTLVAGHRHAAGRRAVLQLVDVPDDLTRLLMITDLGSLLPDHGPACHPTSGSSTLSQGRDGDPVLPAQMAIRRSGWRRRRSSALHGKRS